MNTAKPKEGLENTHPSAFHSTDETLDLQYQTLMILQILQTWYHCHFLPEINIQASGPVLAEESESKIICSFWCDNLCGGGMYENNYYA